MKPDFKIYSSMISIAQGGIWMLLSTLVGFSCISVMEEPYTNTGQEENRVVDLRIWFPSNTTGSESRSITGTEENYISSLYILSFSMEGNVEKFDYWTKGSEKDGNTNGTAMQDYAAELKVRNHPQRFVLLANIGEEVRQQIEQGNWKDMEKEAMLAFLEENVGEPGNKWNAVDPLDYRSLPMWGESIPEIITNTTSNLTATIPLLRMVAKIDVQVDESVTGLTDKFRLGSVRLYNTNTKGSLVPDADKIQLVPGNVLILAPTIPTGIAGYSERHFGPVMYEDFSFPGQPGIAIRNAIYLFETAATDSRLEATCLVVGGYYENSTEQTYYRVDFMKEDGMGSLDMLRNHKYTVNIAGVNQSGYKDPDDAFHSKGEGMEVSILHWNEIDIDEIWFDEVYYYSVSPRLFEKQSTASTGNRIRVETDYPEWSYKLSDNSDPAANAAGVSWLNVTSHQAGQKYPGNGMVDFILFNVESGSANIRTAYIHVTAGRVAMTVTVKQTNWSEPSFIVTPGGIIPPNGQTRTVKATGTFTTVDIRVRESAYNSIIRAGYIMNGINNNSVALVIPAWPETNRTRQVYIEYHNPVTDQWVVIQEDTQRSLYWN